ncbi:GNAT family protein [Hyphococcus flavus]|uniref:GNAT family protein n=1 Tax=Hyphococcus flavus TaxID=1866326 RepID=A0AAE9ZI89_9PROT|nr:GNAT family protein [Hyphococcus flavus]WDI31416.1 GNAT family protein [Hyphococcus flavus]
MFLTKSPSHPAFDPILVRDPVYLRTAKLSDYEQWASLREISREHLIAWEEDWAPDQLSIAVFKRRLASQAKDAKRGGGLSLSVFRRDDRVMVGGVTLTNVRYGASRSGILGYWIGAPYVRLGYGAKAVAAMLDHLFDAISLNRVIAACQPENIASQKLLERCGFKKEGLARDYLKINGAWRDHLIYAVTAADRVSK